MSEKAMNRADAFDHLRALASGETPKMLTVHQRRALAVFLPEMLELPVEWDKRPPMDDVQRECLAALAKVGKRHRLEACGEGGDCYFPRCLSDGCEAQPATRPPTRRGR